MAVECDDCVRLLVKRKKAFLAVKNAEATVRKGGVRRWKRPSALPEDPAPCAIASQGLRPPRGRGGSPVPAPGGEGGEGKLGEARKALDAVDVELRRAAAKARVGSGTAFVTFECAPRTCSTPLTPAARPLP